VIQLVVLAKTTGKTLHEHTYEAVRNLPRFLEWQRRRVQTIAGALNIGVKELESTIFSTVYLHDAGKAHREFQEYMAEAAKLEASGARMGRRGPSHSVFGVPFGLAIPDIEVSSRHLPIGALCILASHSAFHVDLFSEYRPETRREDYCEEVFDLFNQLGDAHTRVLGEPLSIQLRKPRFGPFQQMRKSILAPFLDMPGQVSRVVRDLFSLILAAVHYCDWISSGELYGYRYAENQLEERTKKRIQGFTGWHRFQEDASRVEGNMVLRAPTGQGKTEAAILWAERNCPNGTRLLYLLPTRVTCNAIYRRFRERYGEWVGLSHGCAALPIGEEVSWDPKQLLDRRLLSSTFMMPITVATVDQMLLSALNSRKWEMAYTAATSSAIVMDEIHAYDTYTTSLILEVADELVQKGAKVAFMSATLPRFLRDAIKQTVPVSRVVEDPSTDHLARHRITYTEMCIQDAVAEIVRDFSVKKKVLVVVNTVQESKDMYTRLLRSGIPKEKMVLYHSQFIVRDRASKEKAITDGERAQTEGFVVVATQVVEVSLDIDYDVLYTEAAPLDALVQRMGRVNRKGRKGRADVKIYRPGENSENVYGKEKLEAAVDILKGCPACPDEERLRALVEEQYPYDGALTALMKEMDQVEKNINLVRGELGQIQTLRLTDTEKALRLLARTRNEKLASIEVIPTKFREEVQKLERREIAKAIQYMVRVPAYLAKTKLQTDGGGKFIYLDIPYTWEFGVESPEICRAEST